MPSISRTYFLIDQKNEEIHQKATTSFDQFLIPIQSIERNSRSIETMKNFITNFLPELIDSWFLFNQSKTTFDWSKGILNWSKLAKLNFSQNFSGNHFWHLHCSSIKNTFWFYQRRFTDQTLLSWTIIMLETLKNIILIWLGINFIILALTW